MNPLAWRHEHQLALLVATVVGVIVGLAVGYMYHHVQYATSQVWLMSWSSGRWAVLGGVVGAAIVYVRQLARV
jgi:uncharacterized membrane protein YdcZ (DUF606 family)